MLPNRFNGVDQIPPSLIDEIPNWVLALDEEGEEGQDESTLKPADDQSFIAPGAVCLTAADATLASGEHVRVLFGGDWSWDGSVNRVDNLYLISDTDCSVYDALLSIQGNARFFERWAGKLPIHVQSRLTGPDGHSLRFSLDEAGIVPER